MTVMMTKIRKAVVMKPIAATLTLTKTEHTYYTNPHIHAIKHAYTYQCNVAALNDRSQLLQG